MIAAAHCACCLLAGFTYSVCRPEQKCIAVRRMRATMYFLVATYCNMIETLFDVVLSSQNMRHRWHVCFILLIHCLFY